MILSATTRMVLFDTAATMVVVPDVAAEAGANTGIIPVSAKAETPI